MSYVAIGDTKPGMGTKVRDVAPVAGAICADGPTKLNGKWKCACVANGKYACEDGSDWLDAGTEAHLDDLVAAQDRSRGTNWLLWGAVATVGLTAAVFFMKK